MNVWFWQAVGAALLCGLHQIFTKVASDTISDGLGGFMVESSAALTILISGIPENSRNWNQTLSAPGVVYSVVTGICVGIGTILFFLLFQKDSPLSAVPMILAGGAVIMAIAGIFFFKESVSLSRI
ncbi:MAG: hypothetical protein ABJC04_02190 [Verrucomicrobiota bacterium]